ncbi:MarR family transcriptional regulator [Novosphingobium sp. PC22D]|uniref:MarR family winged helix-turn-helix transcriptional regulator n=1 Tax=Novosphingobium sp. PC22D TaxID=1962403 RepID=UPI003204B6F8
MGTTISQVARLLRRSFDERARAMGVTRPQWQVLSALRRHEGIKQGGLAEILEVEPITAGRMIDRLQEAGLVERRPDPADRRVWRLCMTDRGRELLDQIRPLGDETSEMAFEGVSQSDRLQLYETLVKVRANLARRADAEDCAS